MMLLHLIAVSFTLVALIGASAFMILFHRVFAPVAALPAPEREAKPGPFDAVVYRIA